MRRGIPPPRHICHFDTARGVCPPSSHLVVLLPSRYDGEAYAPPRHVVFAIPIRREEGAPFSSYHSCYFNTPGWGIPFQCWKRTPPSPLPNFPPPCAPPFWRWDSSLTPNFRH